MHRIRQHSDLKVYVPSIPIEEWEFASFSDAAHINVKDSGTQAGSLLALVRRGLGQGRETVGEAPIPPRMGGDPRRTSNQPRRPGAPASVG